MKNQLKKEYNNSIVRNNIVNWLEFDENAQALVIGNVGKVLLDYFENSFAIVSQNITENRKYDVVFYMQGLGDDYTVPIDYNLLKSKLKENGTLILAVKNKMGLRYFSGVADEYTGKSHNYIEGYDGDKILNGSSRKSYENDIKMAGFNSIYFYYPVPDMYFPVEIFSDKKLPQLGELRVNSRAYSENSYQTFDEVKVFEQICRDKEFQYFANDFLIICEK